MNEPEKRVILKQKLYGLLKQLVNLAIKEDTIVFKKVNRKYQKLYEQLFPLLDNGQEGNDWDSTRAILNAVFLNKTMFNYKKIDEQTYNERRKDYLDTANKRFGDLEKYIIIKDLRKHELFRILKNMGFLIQKNKFNEYKKLKNVFVKLHNDIFKGQGIDGEERFQWALALNKLDGIIFTKNFFDAKSIDEKRYKDSVKRYNLEYLEIKKKIRDLLKMKLNFRYSQVYDELLTYMSRNNFDNKQVLELETFAIQLNNHFKDKQNKIFKEIEKVSGLKFSGNVNCFIVKHLGYRAISDPLTVKMSKDFDYLNAVVIHELIHILLRDNQTILRLVNKKFAHEENDFRVHFPVLLIERKVIENLFDNKFFSKIINKDDHNPDLVFEWQEVNKVYDKFNSNIVKFLEKF